MAQDIKNKKSTLEEDALIYEKRDEKQTEREKLSGMNRSEKFSYFRTYYLRLLILFVAVAGVATFFIYDIVTKKDVAYHCVIVNDCIEDKRLEPFGDNFIKFLKLDSKKYESSIQVLFNDQRIAISYGATAANDMVQISSMIAASQLDCMIGDVAVISQYQSNSKAGVFANLEVLLKQKMKMSDENYEKLKPYFYLSPDYNNQPIGIHLKHSKTYQSMVKSKTIIGDPILGFVVNSENMNRSVEFLYYLFPELQKEGIQK